MGTTKNTKDTKGMQRIFSFMPFLGALGVLGGSISSCHDHAGIQPTFRDFSQ
jgi:hypothetical protein